MHFGRRRLKRPGFRSTPTNPSMGRSSRSSTKPGALPHPPCTVALLRGFFFRIRSIALCLPPPTQPCMLTSWTSKRSLFPVMSCPTNATPCWTGKHPCSWTPWADLEPKVNGGVPQAANLTAHIEALRQDIVNTIPDPGFSGLAILDWEAWRPLTSENDDGLSCYTEYSKRLVRAEGGPHAANATWVAEEATARFDAGAQAIFTATVREVKKLRPLARVGFYSQGACPKTARPTPPPRIPPVAHSSSTLCCAVLYGLTWGAGSLPLTAPYPYTTVCCNVVA
jgi:hypothetical protein